MLDTQVAERAGVRGVGAADEIVENLHQLRGRHPLGLLQFQLEEVWLTERPREAVPQLHQFEESVREDELLDLTERIERTAPSLFDRVRGLVGCQGAERGGFGLATL